MTRSVLVLAALALLTTGCPDLSRSDHRPAEGSTPEPPPAADVQPAAPDGQRQPTPAPAPAAPQIRRLPAPGPGH